MNWQEVIESPYLQNLPFKIETNEFGEIIMNPVKIKHSFYQGRMTGLMDRMRQDGAIMVECAIWTPKGTKVADVAWASMETFTQIENKTEAHIAPEICVEVVSRSNTKKEMRMKRKLYFERGAKEVWICNEYGELKFFDESGELEKSSLFPNFPMEIGINQ